ncbi:hypothetical protein IW262DRAFT_1468880 [Armillaria fumosa]|nr:hypothetical protein IW262DRAFT_1468880 [Armillaria fumosa]
MVSVQIAHEDALLQGKGRWACPDFVLKDAKLKEKIKELGIAAQDKIKNVKSAGRTPADNPQKIYEKFISEAMNQARERERTIKMNASKRESDLNRAIGKLSHDNVLSESHSEKLANLKNELKHLKQEEHNAARRFVAAKDHLEGESVSKYYFQANKEAKPRDAIQALEIPNAESDPRQPDAHQAQNSDPERRSRLMDPQPRYEKYSPWMAEMMRDYHGETLQNDGLDVDEETRERTITALLEANVRVSPTEENKEKFRLKTS